MKSAGMAAFDKPLRDDMQGTCGQAAGQGRLIFNVLLRRVINKANAIKCNMKQAAKEMTV